MLTSCYAGLPTVSKVLTERPLEIFVPEDPEIDNMDDLNRFTKFITILLHLNSVEARIA